MSIVLFSFLFVLLFFYKGAYFLLSRFGSWGVRRVVQGGVMSCRLFCIGSILHFFQTGKWSDSPVHATLQVCVRRWTLGNFLVGCWDIQEILFIQELLYSDVRCFT